MVGMHHSITAARWLKRSMRRTTRSSSRWGFRFPWKPDLPRLSPLGQGHPVPAYLPPFPSSRGISHNRCVFTFPSSAIFPFSSRGENSRKMRQDYSEKENYPRSNSTSAKYGDGFGVVSFLAKRRIPRRDRNVAEVRSTLSFRCLFNGRGREKRRKVIICGQPSCEMTFTDSCIIHARLFADPHFANLLPHFLRSPTLSPRVVENNWRRGGGRQLKR